RRVYTHTGYRKHAGQMVYLHAGGAIGPGGAVPGINVQFSGALARYELYLPKSEADLRTTILASLRVADNAPPHVVLPLLAAVFRAAIKPCDFGVWLVGPTGVFKSELAAL